MLDFNESRVRVALLKAWSLETAVQWTPENPASGQCNVTAAVIFDLFAGKILRTRMPNVWHYYNKIDGMRIDFTDSQFTSPRALFDAPIHYDDELTSREEALNGIPQKEYDTLKSALLSCLKSEIS